jgi:hypothetical protein
MVRRERDASSPSRGVAQAARAASPPAPAPLPGERRLSRITAEGDTMPLAAGGEVYTLQVEDVYG